MLYILKLCCYTTWSCMSHSLFCHDKPACSLSFCLLHLNKQKMGYGKKRNKPVCSFSFYPSLSHLLSETYVCSLTPAVVSQQRAEWQRQWRQGEWQLWGQEHSHAQCSCTIPSLANEALIKVSYVSPEGRFHMAQVIQKGNVSQKTPRAQQVSFYRGLPPCH